MLLHLCMFIFKLGTWLFCSCLFFTIKKKYFLWFINFRPKPEANGYYLYEPSKEELHYSDGNKVSHSAGDRERWFCAYVLLERLSPNEIENVL